MNTDTLDKMKQMRLLGMHRAFRTSLESADVSTSSAAKDCEVPKRISERVILPIIRKRTHLL